MASKKVRKDVTLEFLDKKLVINEVELTEKQKQLMTLIRNDETKIVFVTGPAGSSKSFISVLAGLRALRCGARKRLKYIRSLVESSQNKIGYLPGDVGDKTAPYAAPLLDKLEELISVSDSSRLIQEGTIQMLSPNFLRGTTFKNEFVIVDEAQQLPWQDCVTILTRIGEGSTLIMAGDLMQADIKNSGFSKLVKLFSDDDSTERGIHSFHFTADDIMRSEILKFIIAKLEQP